MRPRVLLPPRKELLSHLQDGVSHSLRFVPVHEDWEFDWQHPPPTRDQRALLYSSETWQSAPVPAVGKVWATPPDKCVLS